MRLSQRCRWRFRSSEMLLHTIGWEVADIMKDHSAFFFMIRQSKKGAQTLKIEILQSFEMPWAIHVVQFNIPDYPCLHDHIDFGRMRVERTLFFFVESNCLSPNPPPINTRLSGYLNSKCHTGKHTDKRLLQFCIYRVSRGECARLQEIVP